MKIFSRGQELVEGQTALMKVMRLCRLTKTDGSKLMLLFEDVDRNNDGIIDVEEFFSFLQFDASEGETQKFFLVMEIFKKIWEEKDNSQELEVKKTKNSFLSEQLSIQQTMCEYDGIRRKEKKKLPKFRYVEFFSALYEFLTLDHKGLVRFTFDMIDVRRTGILTKADILDVVKSLLHVRDRKIEKRVQQLMMVLDSNKDGDIDFEEFYAVHIRLATLIFPVFRVQTHIRKRCINQAFWLRRTRQRQRIQKEAGHTPLDFFLYVVHSVPLPVKVTEENDRKRKKKSGSLDDSSASDEDDCASRVEDEISDTKEEDQLALTFDAVGKEEAEDMLDLALEDHMEEHAKFDKAGRKLQRVLGGKAPSTKKKKKLIKQAAASKENEVDDSTSNEQQCLEGPWWVEHKPQENQLLHQVEVPLSDPSLGLFPNRDDQAKIFVSPDTAGILHAAEQSKARAQQLEAGNERREQLLIKVELNRGITKKVIKHTSSCCCCCFFRRRRTRSRLKMHVQPAAKNSEQNDDQPKARAQSCLYIVPSHALESTNGRRTTYTRQITGLPPPSVLLEREEDDTSVVGKAHPENHQELQEQAVS